MGTVLKIQGTNYPVQFGIGALKLLGKKWNLPGFQSVVNKIAGIFPKNEGDELTFESMDLLADVVIAGLQNANKDYQDNFTEEEIQNLVIINPENLKKVADELSASLAQPGNAEPRSKARKTATKKKSSK